MKYLTSDFLRENYLAHYASPYYDPVKAHEYYMKNRELKGRKSTTGLNEKGRIAAQYAKAQINAEYNKIVSQLSQNTASEKSNTQNEYKNSSSSLRKTYSEDTKTMRDAYSADKKAIRDEANSKYETELNNLKSQSEFKKTKKCKKGRKSSSKVKVKSGPGTQDFLDRYKAKKSK